jgi:hypothetical protein
MKQKIYGALLILACAVTLAMAAQGTTPIERDATPAVLLFPLGVYMVVAKKNILHPTSERGHSHGSATSGTAKRQIQYPHRLGIGKKPGTVVR